MRHGQAISNVGAVCSCWPEKFKNALTKKGKEDVKKSAEILRGKRVDLIFSSPLLRTKQTAKVVGKILNVKPKFDKRLREIGFGVFNDKPLEGMWKYFKTEEERIKNRPPRGETYEEILERMLGFLKDADKKYGGNPPPHKASARRRNILIISHEGPLFLFQGKVMGFSIKETIKKFPTEKRIHKGEIRELN